MAAAPKFRVGEHVRVPGGRTGYVTAVRGSGWNALITVRLTGWVTTAFRPGQLTAA
jgi:hypothetical protein